MAVELPQWQKFFLFFLITGGFIFFYGQMIADFAPKLGVTSSVQTIVDPFNAIANVTGETSETFNSTRDASIGESGNPTDNLIISSLKTVSRIFSLPKLFGQLIYRFADLLNIPPMLITIMTTIIILAIIATITRWRWSRQ